MTTPNIFEIATKKKYRFPFRGLISVEDLWDLSLEQLNDVYKTLNKLLAESEEENLMGPNRETDYELTNNRIKIDIVRFIFETKKSEIEANRQAVENARKKQQILEILARKQDGKLEDMSEEDLIKMLDDLK